MKHFDLLLKNASTLLPDPSTGKLRITETDVAVQGGRIQAVGRDLGSAATELDLKGLHLLPGVIDAQVHFREPGLVHKEDLESGTRGALLGGVTCVFEMPNTSPSTTTRETFQQKLDLAKNRCHTHYAFYMGASPENADRLAELETLAHCPGVKVFMGSSTGTLLIEEDVILEKILRSGRRRVAVHAEDEARLKERKHLAIEGAHPRFHPIWRDEETALRATTRLLNIANRVNRPVHVLHVTTAEEMSLLAKNKKIASVEILPQHLTFAAPEVYDRLGTFAQMNPPIRDDRHRQALWKAVLDGTVDVMGSDHAPHTREEKANPYPQSPSGFPGVQTLVPLMLDHVNKGRLPLERFVELVSEGPRRVFGLKDRGRIAPGCFADFTVVDLKRTRTIEESWIASKCGWSPYVGMTVTGWPVMTILEGAIAMRDDEILRPHSGRGVEFQ